MSWGSCFIREMCWRPAGGVTRLNCSWKYADIAAAVGAVAAKFVAGFHLPVPFTNLSATFHTDSLPRCCPPGVTPFVLHPHSVSRFFNHLLVHTRFAFFSAVLAAFYCS
jgi:hypothetical protein